MRPWRAPTRTTHRCRAALVRYRQRPFHEEKGGWDPVGRKNVVPRAALERLSGSQWHVYGP